MSADLTGQSDDCYETILFRRRDGGRAEGTVGWREGADTRVVFNVWNETSFAADGRDLYEAFERARAGIEAQGFRPLVTGAQDPRPDDPHTLFERLPDQADDLFPETDEEPVERQTPRVQPLLWLLVALIVLAIVWPLLAAAEIPRPGRTVAFPNAPYLWRYDGPDFDPSSTSATSAVRLRSEGASSADALTPRFTVMRGESEEPLASYNLEGGSFCDYADDNCALDGIFPMVLASAPEEPVLAAVMHVGVHGQRLAVFRPLRDPSGPVFEVTSDYALLYRVMPDGLFVELEQATASGAIMRDMRMWIAGDARDCETADEIALPQPPGPTAAAAMLEYELRRIARARDLQAFVGLLADDVLVSFGGSGGREEFHQHFDLYTAEGERRFWAMLDRLLATGGWNETGDLETMTWPWFFAGFPEDPDPYDIFIVGPDTPLRAGPDDGAPVVSVLPFGAVRAADPAGPDSEIDWAAVGWQPVRSAEHCLGYLRAEDATHLLSTRMIARSEGGTWVIEAIVAGD